MSIPQGAHGFYSPKEAELYGGAWFENERGNLVPMTNYADSEYAEELGEYVGKLKIYITTFPASAPVRNLHGSDVRCYDDLC